MFQNFHEIFKYFKVKYFIVHLYVFCGRVCWSVQANIDVAGNDDSDGHSRQNIQCVHSKQLL